MKHLFLLTFLVISSMASAEVLTLDRAKKIADEAQKYAGKKSWKVSIAIVNSEGNLILFNKNDGSYSGSIDSSIQKARSANAFQRPTSVFVEAVKSKPGLLTGKDIVAIEGGVPIQINGYHVGAIGVSGAKAIEDEEIAIQAINVLENN